jgi:hypothetical protein
MDMTRKLMSVAEFAADEGNPWTEQMLRWHLFRRETNGLKAAGACVSLGRRVYIDPDAFDRWIDSQQSKPAQQAAA